MKDKTYHIVITIELLLLTVCIYFLQVSTLVFLYKAKVSANGVPGLPSVLFTRLDHFQRILKEI